MAGPPVPYTAEQINAMTSKVERTRARAELNSYIARLKIEKKEKKEREMNQTAGSGNHYNFSSSSGTGPHRGGLTHSGSEYHTYHPYQRSHPRFAQQKFKHRSATFSNPDSGAESSDTNEGATASPRRTSNTASGFGRPQPSDVSNLCRAFISTGTCARNGCRYLHDPTKLALCKGWLYNGECSNGDFCNLSHDSSPNNAPTCVHFQNSVCNNDNCRFAHVRVNSAALNCEQFGCLGYCEKGSSCTELHAYECPTFSNTGFCPAGDGCHLRHIRRASRLRSTNCSSPAVGSSPLRKSDKGEDMADEKQKTPTKIKAEPVHDFTQQADYVPFDADD